jgi:hypothetical protein
VPSCRFGAKELVDLHDRYCDVVYLRIRPNQAFLLTIRCQAEAEGDRAPPHPPLPFAAYSISKTHQRPNSVVPCARILAAALSNTPQPENDTRDPTETSRSERKEIGAASRNTEDPGVAHLALWSMRR